MKHKTIKVEPLKDTTIRLTVEDPLVRKPFLFTRVANTAKQYNRRDFKRFDE